MFHSGDERWVISLQKSIAAKDARKQQSIDTKDTKDTKE